MKSDYLVRTQVPDGLGVSAFVLAANFHNPFECLDEISEELDRQSIKGSVVFDLLLANGSKLNRYFLAEFDGKSFVLGSIHEARSEYLKFSKISADFFRCNIKVIDDVLLSPAMKFAVKRGIPL